ncbi:MAG: 6-pyruvoyl-tetrahydropterin synthase-related protein [Bacillota bacterium]
MQKNIEIEELVKEVARNELEINNVKAFLAERQQSSGAAECTALIDAKRTLAEAEAATASVKRQVEVIENEISHLRKKLELGKNNPDQGYSLMSASCDSSAYSIKLVSFFNARHFVSFGDKPGPVHAHSWQIQLDISVGSEICELVSFSKIQSAIKSVFNPFEDTVLNYKHPFNKIQPTTENMALYFFNSLEEALKEIGLGMASLSVWETPTKGIEVTSHSFIFDNLDGEDSETPPGEEAVCQMAAAAIETGGPELEGQIHSEEKSDREEYAKPLIKAKSTIRANHLIAGHALSIIIITLAAVISYYNTLWPPAGEHYPWGSDTWGHLFKAEYLFNEIFKGNYYPQFTEYWYNGGQPFRYWAPLPYYVIALTRAISPDIFFAGIYYVFGCALFGGLSWLLFSGRMGIWPATAAGVIWTIWQDNARVAFSEGNLPRVMATALLPLLLFILLNVIEKKKPYLYIVGMVALVHLVILCHAMVGAIYSTSMILFVVFLFIMGGCQLKEGIRAILVIAAGIASSSWWLLPSLVGGIASLDSEAVKNAIEFVPANISFNPLNRFTTPEDFYWGISIILALLVTMATWKSKPPWAKSLAVCGIVLILITLPASRVFYTFLPLSNLLWPLRFSSFAAMAVIASCLAFNPPGRRQRLLNSSYVTGFLIAGIFSAFLIDSLFSIRLLSHTNPQPTSIMNIADKIKSKPGWRVATIDLSRLGSAPSYLFSNSAGLEQVAGWAWQGAVTSSNLMLINTGLEMKYYPFLFRSCVNLGATELVVSEELVEDKESFKAAAEKAGYIRTSDLGKLSLWHSVDYPYLVEKRNSCLVVGKYSSAVAMQFPEAHMGSSIFIDDYSLSELKKYPQIIYTGAEWRSKEKAEAIVAEYASSGGKVYIEMAGMPKSVLSKQPEFLGVVGEAVTLRGQLEIKGQDREFLLQPFSDKMPVWKAYVPLGLDGVELEFSYYGNQAPVYGYKIVNGNKIWFLGGNIIYHSFLTGDTLALKFIKAILGLSDHYTVPRLVPLYGYEATENGYIMSYHSDRDFEAILPVASLDGMKAEIDGSPMEIDVYENLVMLNLPGGRHIITLSLTKTPVYSKGAAGTAASLVLVAAGLLYIRRKG